MQSILQNYKTFLFNGFEIQIFGHVTNVYKFRIRTHLSSCIRIRFVHNCHRVSIRFVYVFGLIEFFIYTVKIVNYFDGNCAINSTLRRKKGIFCLVKCVGMEKSKSFLCNCRCKTDRGEKYIICHLGVGVIAFVYLDWWCSKIHFFIGLVSFVLLHVIEVS